MAIPNPHAGHYSHVGECSQTIDRRPLDLSYLSQQTMNDRTLEAEVLGMFAKQLQSAAASLLKINGLERKRLAHALKGTGRSVGAFALADIAAKMEMRPFDSGLVDELNSCIVETCDFIASLTR